MSKQLPMPHLDELQKRLGLECSQINAARDRSNSKWNELQGKLNDHATADTSIVVFGSLARGEFSDKSDIDWTLLIDGSADPKHLDLRKTIGNIIQDASEKPPGSEGTFGNMTSSHNLIHQIGGEDDTNRNTTQRILLLLESAPLGRHETYDRVVKNVLFRYIEEDKGFCSKNGKYSVPRFLLNDFARFWRTVAVDYAYKQRTRFGKGHAIRNLKLRMSRKLIYASGLLACFKCNYECKNGHQCRERLDIPECVNCLQQTLKQPPLEILSSFFAKNQHLDKTATTILTAYNNFLGITSDADKRKHLEELTEDKEQSDSLHIEGRDLSTEFQNGLINLFFDQQSNLLQLVKEYGVF